MIDLKNLGIGDQMIQQFQEGLAASQSLLYINLSENEINADGSKILSDALIKGNVEDLNLSSNQLGDSGLKNISSLISRRSKQLVRLNL